MLCKELLQWQSGEGKDFTNEGERRDEAKGLKFASFFRWDSIVDNYLHLVCPDNSNN